MNPKLKVLFVDDEDLVLQGLQRMLRPLRNEWEMEFCSSGAQALERMAASPFDVVVSDMRMPGMNGAELLNQVMQRQPRTVRLILSGHADQDLIMKCVGTTHQFLSKPCEPETLKNTIARATSLGFQMQNEKLMAVVARMDRLPSFPALYADIVKALQDPEVCMEEVGGIVAKDMAMTANILKLVNPAFFGLRRQIASPAEAASYLGVDVLKSLVLSLHAFSECEATRVKGFSVEALWQHSLQTSAGAKLIAQAERAEPHAVNEAFTAGMLHDVGRMVLAANFPDECNAATDLAASKSISRLEAEREIFGSTHAEAGGYLLGLWGLPVPVVEAIALHHTPSESFSRTFTALTAVHVADVLAEALSPSQEGESQAVIDEAHLTAAGLIDRLPVWRQAVSEGISKAA